MIMIGFFKKHAYSILILFVVVLAAILRFSNYPNRWGLAYDQAHDVVIARYALSVHKVPLLGPFSSAGPFQTGGEWYWFIMLGALIFPFMLQGPWVFLTLVQVLFTLFMIYLGYKVGGKWVGLLAGFFSAISPDGISQSINLTNQSILNVVSAAAILFALLYLKSRKTYYLFWLGFFSTLGATIHLQGVPLIVMSLGVLLLDKLRIKKGLLFLIVGAILPLLPLIYFDMTHHFSNSRGMLQYYLHDQYRISLDVLGRRWSTYVSKVWGDLWAGAIGGNFWVGLGTLICCTGVFIWSVYKRILTKQWLLIVGVFLISVILIRYTRTPIFHSYIMFLHPFIFLFTAFTVSAFFKKQWIVGLVTLLIISYFSLRLDIVQITNATNRMDFLASNWTKVLITKYTKEKFTLYDYKYRSTTFSLPLVLYLQYAQKLHANGYKIGFGMPSDQEDPENNPIYMTMVIKENKVGFSLVDLQSSSSAQLARQHWVSIDPSAIYHATQEWYTNSR